MPEPNGAIKFTPSTKFIIAVYAVELALGGLTVVWLLSRGAP